MIEKITSLLENLLNIQILPGSLQHESDVRILAEFEIPKLSYEDSCDTMERAEEAAPIAQAEIRFLLRTDRETAGLMSKNKDGIVNVLKEIFDSRPVSIALVKDDDGVDKITFTINASRELIENVLSDDRKIASCIAKFKENTTGINGP